MKKILFIILLIFAIFNILVNVNYELAMSKARNSEGSDLAIEQSLSDYGFRAAWDENITYSDKIQALFNNY